MFWLGLLMPVAYVPGWTGAMIITGWSVLSCLLPFLLLRRIEMGWGHWLGAAFLAYATLSLAWAPVFQQGVWDLWLTYILAGCFCLGASGVDLRKLWIGMALGLSISDVIAVVQRLGYSSLPGRPIPGTDPPDPLASGLFINPDMFGEIAALVTLGLLSVRAYRYLPLTLAPILFTQSHGVYLMYAVVGALWLWDRYRWLALVPCVAATLWVGWYVAQARPSSSTERLALWQDTIDGLTPLGRGPGSFFMLYPEFASRTDTMATRPEDPHNEYLNLAFEYGLGAIPILTILALSLACFGPERYIVAGFLTIAFVSFPSRIAPEGFAGMVALGSLCRSRTFYELLSPLRRSTRNPWQRYSRSPSLPMESLRAHTRGV